MMIRINQEESKNPDFLALPRSNNSESLGYAGEEPPDRAGKSLIEFQNTQLVSRELLGVGGKSHTFCDRESPR